MSEEVIDQQKVTELVASIRDQFVLPYRDAAALKEIKSSTSFKDSDPLTEIGKLSQIIKAHSTKIGIICQPSKFFGNYPAVFKEFQSFANALFYLLSVLPLIHDGDMWAMYLVQKLDSTVINLLNGVSQLCDGIDKMINEGKGDDEDRLACIGILWTACESLEEIAKKGNFQLLADNIRNSCGLVDDVLQDVDSWLQDPHFGADLLIDDDFSDNEDRESDKEGSDDEVALEKMAEFLKLWQTRLKMIKLLLSSFAKSMATNVYNAKNTKASILDKLNALQSLIVEQLDELFSDIFLSDASFSEDDFASSVSSLNDSLRHMVKVITKLNTSDAKKLKWIQVWETKYFPN
ncbi:hypothetical protein HG536_0H03990 [Torulaspora globosa]|uniref:Uncharacterized protein n=1 Tax=Torulaspora globosa TaxID=48254 RepID=A0A7G3ZND7_9SACH|nr:uncharacterized protein HG536_0H03990 [Torulaspora globosa]QLL35023.1 hypothetical protein HG536_0H03990 [Torulaspora globosa]